MLTILLVLAVVVTAVALVYARWEYRIRGRLTLLGTLLLCAMILVPNLMLHYTASYEMPDTPLDYAGVLISAIGIALCVAGMTVFRSPLKVLCLDPGKLSNSGPYRWSRNPQYVGWFMFLLGFALNDWSLWCLVTMLIVALYLHLLILVEEEHLRRKFGEQYAEYCQSVPRYLGWPLTDKHS
jgi:protein-S-isoprenylcysteine O-methyltransferase Ste14